MKNGRYILALTLLLATVACQAALAAGGGEARARQPAYDSTSLELVGAGSYVSEVTRAQLRVTVCLRKTFGNRSFDVRCETVTGSGRRVKAEVSVPGCVAGLWRTTTTGEALDRNGDPVDSTAAVSRKFRC